LKLKVKHESGHHILVPIAKTRRAVNSGFDAVKLHRPTEGGVSVHMKSNKSAVIVPGGAWRGDGTQGKSCSSAVNQSLS